MSHNGHTPHAPEGDPIPTRQLSDVTLPYLMERNQLLEGYVATMFQMLLNHHPYLGPAANEISQLFQLRHEELEARHPVSSIIMPPSGIMTPN